VSARAVERSALPPTLVLIGGIALLVIRPAIVATTTEPVPLLATLMVLIAVASITIPIPADVTTPALPAATTLTVGLLAVLLARTVTGPPPPLPLASAAPILSTLAAVAEEALFHRLAYARLLPHGAPVAVVGSAVLFGLLHAPLYGIAAVPVDLGAGLLLSWQRWASGRWTVPAATHAAANLVGVFL
jgi:membrane protease YdiL (CAAX protease family)